MLCKNCGKEISGDSKFCEFCGIKQDTQQIHDEEKPKKSILKRWWFWLIVVFIVIMIASGGGGAERKSQEEQPSQKTEQELEAERKAAEKIAEEKKAEEIARKKAEEEQRQKDIESLAKTFCENRKGEYVYGTFVCACVDLNDIVKLLESKGETVTLHNAERPPTKEICKKTAELCLKIWNNKDCTNMAEQNIWLGMSKTQLYISLGAPKDKNNTVGVWGIHSQWVYGDFGPYVYLEGESEDDLVVTSWQD